MCASPVHQQFELQKQTELYAIETASSCIFIRTEC